MKRTAIYLSLILFLSACAAEFKIPETDVPPGVKDAFNTKYPNAIDPKWEAEKHKGHLTFEVEFTFDGKKKEACFKPDGSFIKAE